MSHRKPNPTSHSHPYIFVLWGEQCEEATTAIFVSELRAAGLLVKLVGLSGLHAGGIHGLALTPDMTLSQALPLARLASCVVIPCPPSTLHRLAGDPRLQEFLLAAQAHHATLIVDDIERSLLDEIGIHPSAKLARDIFIYPPGPELFNFIQNVIPQLREVQDMRSP